MNVHVFTILHVIFYIYVIYVKKVHKNPDIHATNQNLETRIDLSAAIHDIHTEGGTNCHTSTNMIRDERTAATGGRTINPFWVTGSTVKPEICIPFPIFFFLLSLPSFFFVILLPLFFGGNGSIDIRRENHSGETARAAHTRARLCCFCKILRNEKLYVPEPTNRNRERGVGDIETRNRTMERVGGWNRISKRVG